MSLNLFIISGISVLVMGFTSLLAYEIMGWVWGLLPKLAIARRVRVVLMLIPIYAVHIISIWVYALVYYLLLQTSDFGTVTGFGQYEGRLFHTFMDCLYFSGTTYTSLGFGDLLASGSLRMLAMAEVLNGLVLIGWTASFTYLAMTKFWGKPTD